MQFSLDQRTASLSVGELADFNLGPRDGGEGGAAGIWRAQLGTHWHQQLRIRAQEERAETRFEVPLVGGIFHRGWTLTLTGRIDQLFPDAENTVLREIKTVTRALPADESELRAEYPSYFAQLGIYLSLVRSTAESVLPNTPARLTGELVFVEADSGLSQTVTLVAGDEEVLRVRLEAVTEFLDLRWRARQRLRALRFHSPFAELRPGQENVQVQLTEAMAKHPVVFFEAPTGFGKTGALLEFALARLKQGGCERVIYLTSKATGQLQVTSTVASMTAENAASWPPAGEESNGVAVWHVRNKREHCINAVFQCMRDCCAHLNDVERRWPQSGLSRFFLFDRQPRDLETLRAAGRAASICPYEITRSALAFSDVWIGDYNYVFSPGTRGLFGDQPGFDPKQSLLIVDEAHNLPSRVADAYSHTFSAGDAAAVSDALHRARPLAALVNAWNHWANFLQGLPASDSLRLADEDDARDLLETLSKTIASTPVDLTTVGPGIAELLWEIPSVTSILAEADLPRLWWCPRPGVLSLTCLDAAKVIGATLRGFGGVVLASATLRPTDAFAGACGLDAPPEISPPRPGPRPERLGGLNKRLTRKLYSSLTTASELLQVEEAREASAPALVEAAAPWRDGAYDIAVDLRVDTTYQQRDRHHPTTAATIQTFHARLAQLERSGLMTRALAVFFPSYAYAESILKLLQEKAPGLRAALQPRQADLRAQAAWMEQALTTSDALFLVLGSSFAEGIDALGGRVTHAMVIGPALPEVNAVQRARGEALSGLGREAAFRRVYQVPGIQKVNQALGRLVRAPGQTARVLLHCRRFAEPGYASLLAAEYQEGTSIAAHRDLEHWLTSAR